ncbi:MAG: hypothetical protein AAF587_03180 [Bacteroidota bacterium]
MKLIIHTFIFFFLLSSAFAQQDKAMIPLRIGLVTHSVGMPFKNPIKRPLNWGISIGTTFVLKQGKISNWGQDIDMTWYRHQELGQGILLYTSLMRDFQTNFGLSIGPKVGLGYLHTFSGKQVFALQENGSYQQVTDFGRGGLLIGLGARMGWDLEKQTQIPIKPYIEYEWKGQVPHSQFTTLFPHSFVQLGAQYTFTYQKN